MSSTHSSSMLAESLMNSCVSAAVKVWMRLPRSDASLRAAASPACTVRPSQPEVVLPLLASMTRFRSGASDSYFALFIVITKLVV